jgi:TPR repeat protein
MAYLEGSIASFDSIAASAGAATPDALYQLGLQYCLGLDVELDLVAAHKWFNLAALRGNSDARRMRGEISSEMSRDEIAIAQREAREWLRHH